MSHALFSCLAVATMTGCGGSQPPIGAPGAMDSIRSLPISPQCDRGRSHRAFSRGASITRVLRGAGGAWDADVIWPGTAEVDCMVGRARFADGSDWENQDWLSEEHSTDLIIPVLDQP
jgi:hypothetical protein